MQCISINCAHCGKPMNRYGSSSAKFCSIACRFFANKRWKIVGECWEWYGSINPQTGYGMMSNFHSGKSIPIGAHRVSWVAHFGEIPDGMYVLHKCDNRKCVNPSHLFVGSQRDNIEDMRSKGRAVYTGAKTHWTSKHPEKIRRGADHHLSKDPSCMPRGIENHNAKITDEDVRIIRASNETLAELSKMFGLSQSTLSSIKRRKTWKHVA